MPRKDDGPTVDVPGDEALAAPAPGSPWTDLDAYVALPRLGGLTLSHDGRDLVVGVARLDQDQTGYATALWRVDPHGIEPARRLTRSVEGEAAAAFLPDGRLLFTSRRPVPKTGDDVSDTTRALWCLPEHGEAYVLARRDGGWDGVHTAPRASRAVFAVPMHAGAADETADAAVRKARKEHKVSAILHEGYPVRFWDHDLGPEATRLVVADLPAADEPLTADAFRPLSGDVGRRLLDVVLSDDGTRAGVTLRDQAEHGVNLVSAGYYDIDSGELTVVAPAGERYEYGVGGFSHDGRQLFLARTTRPNQEQVYDIELVRHDLTTGEQTPVAPGWDRWCEFVGCSPDDSVVYVSADEDGAHALFAITLADGSVRRLTADRSCYAEARLSPDGTTLYALRSSYACPGEVVAVDTASGEVRVLDCGIGYPELPGTLERIETTAADGTRVPGYLCLPDGANRDHPAKLALWIHGGPVSSWNAWSWRWCPWLLVSQGYAVALPDPALSTGYGRAYVQRGWGRWGAEPFDDLMSFTDAVVARPEIDAEHACAMGGSFGGYMANWVAGHTKRFRAIVSHASLWNLETFGATTDAGWFWNQEMSPEMAAHFSPHRFAAQISTPMLVIHGDQDYRVPIGEGLALWWELVSNFDGALADLPHKFLYFPDECHWVLAPQHAKLWYATVRAFLATQVDGKPFERPELL